jgi:hypothetical protein
LLVREKPGEGHRAVEHQGRHRSAPALVAVALPLLPVEGAELQAPGERPDPFRGFACGGDIMAKLDWDQAGDRLAGG